MPFFARKPYRIEVSSTDDGWHARLYRSNACLQSVAHGLASYRVGESEDQAFWRAVRDLLAEVRHLRETGVWV